MSLFLFINRAEEMLGGCSCLLIGDWGQLPPVMDLPLYSKVSRMELSDLGCRWAGACNLYCTWSTSQAHFKPLGRCGIGQWCIVAICYEEGQCPPDLPVAVTGLFDTYISPTLSDGTFPITPLHRTWFTTTHPCSRLQLPLKLAWAINYS